MININNIFNYCDDLTEADNILYTISDLTGNTLPTLAIKNNDKRILTYSSEWLYLIKCYYPNSVMYNNLINLYNKLYYKNSRVQIINDSVYSLITSFSTGTVHGYSGLYYMLCEYLDNYEQNKDLKLIVYRGSQSGILEIIDHLCNRDVLDRNKIIYLDKNIIYNIRKIKFIKNIHHIFDNGLAIRANQLIEKYVSQDRNDLNYYKSLNLNPNINNLCIIKGTNSENLTSDGIFRTDVIANFCNKFKLTLIEPSELHEIYTIHYINQCTNLIISWGTSFLKNYIYISNKCNKIIVLIMDKSPFLIQYQSALNNNTLLTKFKNADIIYVITDNYLNINLRKYI